MKYKLIAADFDHTLSPTPDKPSQRTVDTIKKYIAKGGIFVVATGRMTHGILSNLGDIQTNAPLICYQGAKIIDLSTKQTLKDYPIPLEIMPQLIEDLAARKIKYGFYHDEKLYVPRRYAFVSIYTKMNNIGYTIVPNVLEFLQDGNKCPTKIISILRADRALKYEKELSKKYEGILSVTRSAANFLEFNSFEAKKGNAVKYVAENIYGLTPNEVICFGDSTNDLSMLRYAGLGVAMGNGMEELKAGADLVCDTCKNDGVAKIIEEYCLKED